MRTLSSETGIVIADICHNHTTGGGVLFFRADVLFSIENAKFWPILTILGYFVANLRTFWCTFYRPRSNVAMYQNGQMSDMAG